MDYRHLILLFAVLLASGCMGSTSTDERSTDFQELEQRSVELKENISHLSSEGGGSTVRVNFTGLRAKVNESGNYLDLEVDSEKEIYPEKFTLVDGEGRAGIGGEIGFGYEGEDQQGVVLARTENGTTTYRIEFRKMRVYQEPYEMYKVQLEGPEETVKEPYSVETTLLTIERNELQAAFEEKPSQVRTVKVEFNQ